jgi:hypothetical protein
VRSEGAGPQGSWTKECRSEGERERETVRLWAQRSYRTQLIQENRLHGDSAYTRKQVTRRLRDGDRPGAHGRPAKQMQLLESWNRRMRRGCGRNQVALRIPKNPKTPPPSSPKPPAFIAKPGGRYNHSPAFHIVDLALIKFRSAVLDSSALISTDTNGPNPVQLGRSTLQAGSLLDLPIPPKPIPL